jgi:hypothetical protein
VVMAAAAVNLYFALRIHEQQQFMLFESTDILP